MPTTEKSLRVLIVDDNRDGADALGLLLEELGNQVHVTYGGTKALEVAAAFRPDLMLIDLLMPEMDGCSLVMRFRQSADFARTKVVAITGQKSEEHKASALKAGFDAVLFKPVSLSDMKAALAGANIVSSAQSPRPQRKRRIPGTHSRLPIGEARRIRNERESKTLTQAETQAAICEGITGFQEEYMGLRSEQIHAHFIKELLIVRIHGTLTLAERQLSKSLTPEKGRDLIKQTRTQLVELARPMLESLIHEVTGVKIVSMHHDISTVTGEEVIVFTFVEAPGFG
jgi:CheY-like chemotaxis protein/uncharacterized protein YbcI